MDDTDDEITDSQLKHKVELMSFSHCEHLELLLQEVHKYWG